MKPTPKGWPRLSSALFYDDASKAIDWLCEAFGFEIRLKVVGEGGRIEHSELTFGDDALIMVAQSGVKPKMPLYPPVLRLNRLAEPIRNALCFLSTARMPIANARASTEQSS